MATPITDEYAARFDAPLGIVVDSWTAIGTAKAAKSSLLATYVQANADEGDAWVANEAALAAWVAAGSLGSGSEYNAKVATAATLVTKTADNAAARAAMESNYSDLLVATGAIESAAMDAFRTEMSTQTYEPEGPDARIARAVQALVRVLIVKDL